MSKAPAAMDAPETKATGEDGKEKSEDEGAADEDAVGRCCCNCPKVAFACTKSHCACAHDELKVKSY
jgi:hypothetical protein